MNRTPQVLALRTGVRIILAHEMPSLVHREDDSWRHPCHFNEMWTPGWTPSFLLKGDANIYKQIAVALKAGPWRKPGLVQLGQKLAAKGESLPASRKCAMPPRAAAMPPRAAPLRPSLPPRRPLTHRGRCGRREMVANMVLVLVGLSLGGLGVKMSLASVGGH